MPPMLYVNPRSGTESPTPDELAAAAREHGVDVHLLREGEDLLELARAADADVLGVAGGDGTLAPVATAALERDLPFVVVPYGTRNHFARDLGLDRDDPLAALAAFGDGSRERRVDVGRVNDRLFLNNVSLGLYARLVHRREHHRRRSEVFARLRALVIPLTHREPLGLTIDGDPVSARVVFVGNNAYSLDVFSVGARERLDEGVLHVYCASGWTPGTWQDRRTARVTIGAAPKELRAAVDGEPEELETPIELRVEPRALRVRLPPGVEDERDAAEGELAGLR